MAKLFRTATSHVLKQRIAELEAYQAEILKSHEWEQNRAMELEAQNKNYLATIKSQLATIKSQSEDKREFWTQTQAERDQLAEELAAEKDEVDLKRACIKGLSEQCDQLAGAVKSYGEQSTKDGLHIAELEAERVELMRLTSVNASDALTFRAERDQLAASLETAQRALEAIRNTYYNQQISTLHVAVTMCSFAQEALAQIAKPAKPEPGMKCGYCGERWPKPGHFDDRGFCRSSREFGLEG